MEQPHTELEARSELTLGPHRSPADLKTNECEICTRILDVLRKPERRERISIGNRYKLLNDAKCDTHKAFFRWFFRYSLPGLTVDDDGHDEHENHNTDRDQTFMSNFENEIRLGGPTGSSGDHTLHGEILLTSLEGHPVAMGKGRFLDRHWIDENLIVDWKSSCEQQHGKMCSLARGSSLPRPQLCWLIDTFEHRLVQANDDDAYVALSYVWGNCEALKTTMQNLDNLCIPGALLKTDCIVSQTVKDAIGLVPLLGERYLWVDALCITQDDERTREYLVNNMAAVYANATLTIVAADNIDANSGLRGLKGISKPRDNLCVFDLPNGTRLNRPSEGGLGDTEWNRRGWTFQEYIFSRRRLIFVADSVRWECGQACFWEEHTDTGFLPTPECCAQWDNDNVLIRQASLSTISVFPNMEAYKALAFAYSERHFTFSEDAMDAFSGIATALAPSFRSGFLWGLPVMFLDMCLIWRTESWDWDPISQCEPTFRRRWSPRSAAAPERHAPIWSWVAWQGTLRDASLWRNEDFVLYDRDTWYYPMDYMKRVIPLVRWSTRQTTKSVSSDIAYQNEWYVWKMRYSRPDALDEALLPGWSRWPIDLDSNLSFVLDPDAPDTMGRSLLLSKDNDKHPPSFYYTHESTGAVKFNYPVPLRNFDGNEDQCDSDSGDITSQPALTGRYLCCSTHRAYFQVDFPKSSHKGYDLVDPDHSCDSVCGCLGEQHGILWPHDPSMGRELDAGTLIGDGQSPTRVELVAVSMMWRAKGGERWKEPLGGEMPQSYNVLWVEWIDGVAYRKGIGEVRKGVWESQERQQVELILG